MLVDFQFHFEHSQDIIQFLAKLHFATFDKKSETLADAELREVIL